MLLSEQTAGQQPLHSTPTRIGRSQKGGRHQPPFATRTIRRKYAIRAGGSLLGWPRMPGERHVRPGGTILAFIDRHSLPSKPTGSLSASLYGSQARGTIMELCGFGFQHVPPGYPSGEPPLQLHTQLGPLSRARPPGSAMMCSLVRGQSRQPPSSRTGHTSGDRDTQGPPGRS